MNRSVEYVGVDGCPDGWLAVEYSNETFRSTDQYDDIEDLWEDHDTADFICR